jgi:L-ascorbate metabolism protein UlaG (beta-lactamase superfamily)
LPDASTTAGPRPVSRFTRIVERLLAGVLALIALTAVVVTLLWRDRVDLDHVPIPPAPDDIVPGDNVSVTWFGVATLLFDDGETQLLVDGFVSRPSLLDLLTRRPVDNDVAAINRFLNDFDVSRLAAVIPCHTHFDHALDIGAIANRTGAVILGSSSSAQVARGSGVPGDQVIVARPDYDYQFGRFTVRLLPSRHAPMGWNGTVPLAGTIDSPLVLPAPVTAFREGKDFAILVSHPGGTALVQASAGFRDDALAGVHADTVFLGVGMLQGLGREYIARYWRETVTTTGARAVIPIHFDDYTQAFGTIRSAPRVLDDFSVTARLLRELQQRWDADTQLYLPTFGVPMPLLAGGSGRT